MKRFYLSLIALLVFCFHFTPTYSAGEVVNIYAWPGVIPDAVIQQFEHETGIKVNFSTYDSNETMYAKLRATKNAGYDIIEPSSYFVDRMRRQHMLEKIDKSKIPNLKHINPVFLNQSYDPHSEYCVPFVWGVTGIFINTDYYKKDNIKRWSDLWDPKYKDQLMFLNDSREVFSVGLRVAGYHDSDNHPEHIKNAFLKLKELMPNIKLFNSDAVISIFIDEDAAIGMAWNGGLYKAKKENPKLDFIYPEDGFVIWVDNFSIPKNAPNLKNAYLFLNFITRPDVAKAIAIDNNYPTANLSAQKLLPEEMRNSPIIYPSATILRRGKFQTDIDDTALTLYEKYWEQLKMGG